MTKGEENQEDFSKKNKNLQKVNITINEENILIVDRKIGVTILQHAGDKITSVHQHDRTHRCLWYVYEAVDGIKELVAIKTKKWSYPLILQALLEMQIEAAKKKS